VLPQANGLTRQPSGIFVREGYESIAYSDGEETEHYLADVLSRASDLSSTSAELEKHIRDWPSEYHLSSKRANIFRGLDLPAQGRVLEIGCGCGAITRYLGEQGLSVDAIEGSRARAELAAMRCRDLENVNITCANFNELTLPDAAYDLVVVVGVIEYAARFRPGESTDQDAVTGLLRSLKKSLRPGGVIAVAIENRTGLKYVLGAHEDHYSRRYVGVHGYPDSAGIRTYTRNEWSALISAAGIGKARYLFPFPDYKVPTVLLSEGFTARNPQAYAHIEGIASRDYTMMFLPGATEPVFWQAASATGTLGEFANSFLILMSDDDGVLDRIAGIDFVHLPDFRRKRKYCVAVRKRTGSCIVERRRLAGEVEPGSNGPVHVVQDETWLEGTLLSVEWSRSLLIDPWAVGFNQLLSRYHDYLKEQTLNIDLVPNNIMVLDTGEYRHFDPEWQGATGLDQDYLLSRALMLFALRHRSVMTEFARRMSLYTIGDFILYGFATLGMDVRNRLAEFTEKESEFQRKVNEETDAGSVGKLLATRLDQPQQLSPVYAQVYWRQRDQTYTAGRSMTAEALPVQETARLEFDLPPEAVDLSHIRFDPCDQRNMDDIGFMQITYLAVEAVVGDEPVRVMDLEGSEEIAAKTALSGIVYSRAEYGDVFAVVGDDPEIECRLDPIGMQHAGYKVIVECSHIRSPQYRLVRDRFLVEEEILKDQLAEQKNQLVEQKRVNARLEHELAVIKSSKLWKAASIYRALRGRGGT
jgi:2-polyprenyl-3-methyl-5-hydroxy-6-metoxy-1,4-benzoquinol methylase